MHTYHSYIFTGSCVASGFTSCCSLSVQDCYVGECHCSPDCYANDDCCDDIAQVCLPFDDNQGKPVKVRRLFQRAWE